jgi:predicted Zn-dependent protease
MPCAVARIESNDARRGARRRAPIAAGIAVLSVLSGGCAMNPVSGRPELVLVSRGQEQEMGQEESRRVADEMGLVDSPALGAYVERIGRRLAGHAPGGDANYSFRIVDMDEPNAFALPGGYVYVSRGLLALMNSEDELAGVIGHEIGHVAARHAVRRITRAAPIAVLSGVGAAVTGIVSPMLGRAVGGIGGMAGALVLAPYSRGQENEADRVGQTMAASAGWDPEGIAHALHTLEREESLQAGRERPMSFFATHPPLPERVAATTSHARSLERAASQPIAGSRTAFLQKLDGLPTGARPSDGVVEGERFSHPDLGFATSFPPGWKVANSREAVGAASPTSDAVIVLASAGEGSDPKAAMHELEKASKTDLSSRAESFRIGELPAVRVHGKTRTDDGVLALELTWVALDRRIYRFAAATRPSESATHQPAFRGTVESFRRLTAAERGGFREQRLRLVKARRGESIASLMARAGSSGWSPAMASVANGLTDGATLADGQVVKVPIAEPYRPR